MIYLLYIISLSSAGVTDYYELPTGINVYFGNSSKTLGSYQLWLMATKSTLTTVKYYGGCEVWKNCFLKEINI